MDSREELLERWLNKRVLVERPSTDEEKELFYGNEKFGGVFLVTDIYEDDGSLWILGDEGFAQRLTEDTTIEEYVE